MSQKLGFGYLSLAKLCKICPSYKTVVKKWANYHYTYFSTVTPFYQIRYSERFQHMHVEQDSCKLVLSI